MNEWLATQLEDRPEWVSDLHWALHVERLTRLVNCVEHDLAGPASSGVVFATCTKCGGRFKVRIKE